MKTPIRQTTRVGTVVLALAVAGCGGEGEPISIGEDSPRKTGDMLSDYSAHWTGYVEADAFWSGSDRVALTLNDQGIGSITFGAGTAPLPVSDADVGYPVGYDYYPQAFAITRGLAPLEGYPYSALNTHVENGRLKFEVRTEEVLAGWCALQTSYPVYDDPGHYSCTPTAAIYIYDEAGCSYQVTEGSESVQIDCAKYLLCSDHLAQCECEEGGCTASGFLHIAGALDGRLEASGQEFTGTLRLDEDMTVRLTRQ